MGNEVSEKVRLAMDRALETGVGLAGCFCAAVLLLGCVAPSLNGLGAEGRVTRDDFVGTWVDDTGDLKAIVEAPKGDAYRVGVMAGDHLAWLEAHAVDLGGGLIGWDATLEARTIKDLIDRHGAFLVPAYQIGTVEVKGDTGVLRFLKPDWYDDQIDSDKALDGRTASAKQGWVVATGSEDALRQALRRAAKVDDAMIGVMVYRVGKRGEE